MPLFYSDLNNLAQTIRDEVPKHSEGSISVVETHAVVDGLTLEEVRRRNIIDHIEEICSVRWDYGEQLRSRTLLVRLQIHFHENEMDSEFIFRSSGGDFTRLANLSSRLGEVEGEIMREFDTAKFDFLSADSGSISGGFDDGLADREFKYEQVVEIRAQEP